MSTLRDHADTGGSVDELKNEGRTPPAIEYERRELLFFLALVAITIIPVWTTPAFPSTDGPIHVWILDILINKLLGAEASVVGKFVELNSELEPNFGFYVLLLPIALLFGPLAAEKLFLTLYAFLFCVGGRFALLKLYPTSGPASFLLIPMAFNLIVHFGYYNFILGVAFFLPFLVFCYLEVQKKPSLGNYLRLAAVGLISCMIHLLPFAVLCLSLAILITSNEILSALERGRAVEGLRTTIEKGGWLIAAFLPALAIAIAFLQRQGITKPASDSIYWNIRRLAEFSSLASFDESETWLFAIPFGYFVVLVVAIAAWQILSRRILDRQTIPAFSVPILLTVICIFPPFSTVEIGIGDRLMIFVLISAVLAAGSVPLGHRWRSAIPLVAAAFVFLRAGMRFQSYAEDYYGVISSFEELIPENSTILVVLHEEDPIREWTHRYYPSEPLLHFGAHLARSRDSVYLRATLLSTTKMGYFPVQYRQDMDPFVVLSSNLEEVFPPVDFLKYEETVGELPDFVIILGRRNEEWRARQPATYEVINQRYQELRVSANGRFAILGVRPPADNTQ